MNAKANPRTKPKPKPKGQRSNRPRTANSGQNRSNPQSSAVKIRRGDVLATDTQKLQKVLAQSGLGSRRKMEELIEQGLIKVNGRAATLGTRVSEADRIEYGRRRIQMESEKAVRVIVYHKPDGEIVSRSDPKGRPTVFKNLPKPRNAKWIAIGRLDFNTSGLLIFTTSGELANRLMHPSFDTEREYSVRIFGELNEDQFRLLEKGLDLTDGRGRFELCEPVGGEGRNRWYRVVVKEGRNRFVRRMFEALGYQVSRLIRIRFGDVLLPPRLTRGKWSELDAKETERLMSSAGLSSPDRQTERKPDAKSARVRRKTKSRPD